MNFNLNDFTLKILAILSLLIGVFFILFSLKFLSYVDVNVIKGYKGWGFGLVACCFGLYIFIYQDYLKSLNQKKITLSLLGVFIFLFGLYAVGFNFVNNKNKTHPISICKFKNNIKKEHYKEKLTLNNRDDWKFIKREWTKTIRNKYVSLYEKTQRVETENGYKILKSLLQKPKNVETINKKYIEVFGCLRTTKKGTFYITKESYDNSPPLFIYIIN